MSLANVLPEDNKIDIDIINGKLSNICTGPIILIWICDKILKVLGAWSNIWEITTPEKTLDFIKHSITSNLLMIIPLRVDGSVHSKQKVEVVHNNIARAEMSDRVLFEGWTITLHIIEIKTSTFDFQL